MRRVARRAGARWVLELDSGYRVSLVGTPDRRNLWLLAREPAIDPAIEAEYLAEARAQGFDQADWIRTPQSGRSVTDDMLAD
ncbi:MAG TPA: lipocalin family protein [Microbacterium sp.]|nr:lipocalin family protein [Microbacterium sp.]